MAHFVNASGSRISKSIQRSSVGASLTVGVWGAAGLKVAPNDPSAASMVPLGGDSSGVSWFRLTPRRETNVMIEARNSADRAVWDFFQLAVSGAAPGATPAAAPAQSAMTSADVQLVAPDRRAISRSIQTLPLGVALVIGVRGPSSVSVGPNDPSMAWLEPWGEEGGLRWLQLTGRRVGHVMVEARVAGEAKPRDFFQLAIVPAAQPNPGEELLAMGPEYARDPSYVDHVTAGHYSLQSGEFRVDHRDGSSIELDFARIQRDMGPSGGAASIYVYYRNLADGKIYPRIFDRHTAPNITAMVEETAAAIPDAQLLQLAVEGIMRLVPVSGPGPGPSKRGVWKTVPPTAGERANTLIAKLLRAGKRICVNVGGTGEVADAINLNPNRVAGRGEIPNLIQTWGERIAELFRPDSVDEIVSNRLPQGVLNWDVMLRGARQVLKPGGRITIRIYPAGDDGARMVEALRTAGFRNVTNLGNVQFQAIK